MNASSQSWDVARSALALEVLHQAGRLRLEVRGESMLPALWPGDEVEIVVCRSQDLLSGEIVLAHRDGRFFLHRFLVRLDADTFVLRGDAMPASDPPFASPALLGRLVRISHHGRSKSMHLRLWTRPLGLLFCHCGPARRLALKLHRWRSSRVSVPLPATATGAHDWSS